MLYNFLAIIFNSLICVCSPSASSPSPPVSGHRSSSTTSPPSTPPSPVLMMQHYSQQYYHHQLINQVSQILKFNTYKHNNYLSFSSCITLVGLDTRPLWQTTRSTFATTLKTKWLQQLWQQRGLPIRVTTTQHPRPLPTITRFRPLGNQLFSMSPSCVLRYRLNSFFACSLSQACYIHSFLTSVINSESTRH